MKTELVKIRKERDYYLAYFNELRKVIPVNYIGSKIIDSFFNQQLSIGEITNLIRHSYKKYNVSQKDIINFLQQIQKELILNPRGNIQLYQKPLSAPIAVEIEITTRCNLRCKHCCVQKYDKLMSMNKIKYILKLLNDKKVFEISLAGGEPFLHPHILKILALCRQYNFATIITTNATLLNESLIKKLAKFKNLAFVISLEGVGEINDMIRGKGVFEKVDQAIKKLKENNMYVEISSTITKKNINHLRKLLEYSSSLDIICNFNLFKPFKENHKSYILKPKQYFKFVEELFQFKKLHKSKATLPNAGAIFAYLEEQKNYNECYAINCAFTIDVEGNMVPCPALQTAGYYNNKKLPKFDENFIDTWKNNQYFQKFRKGNLKECQARSYIFSRNINGEDPYGINAFKRYQRSKIKIKKEYGIFL
jgi:MoaA/NifB/PqqE/SkfB family radical SAM enzyme